METPLSLKDQLSRRRFVEKLARTALGVSVTGSAFSDFARAQTAAAQPLADHCILLLMTGGMPHLDTFDPKPGKSEVMGPTGVVKSAITGEPFADTIPLLAAQADKWAVIRSMYQKTADHQQATYTMRTSYPMIPSIIQIGRAHV